MKWITSVLCTRAPSYRYTHTQLVAYQRRGKVSWMKFHHLTEKLEKHTIPYPPIAFTKHYTKHYTTILSHTCTLPWIESSYVQIYVQPGVETAYAHEYIRIHTPWTLVLQHMHMYSIPWMLFQLFNTYRKCSAATVRVYIASTVFHRKLEVH